VQPSLLDNVMNRLCGWMVEEPMFSSWQGPKIFVLKSAHIASSGGWVGGGFFFCMGSAADVRKVNFQFPVVCVLWIRFKLFF
jgi:hypothetical protein